MLLQAGRKVQKRFLQEHFFFYKQEKRFKNGSYGNFDDLVAAF